MCQLLHHIILVCVWDMELFQLRFFFFFFGNYWSLTAVPWVGFAKFWTTVHAGNLYSNCIWSTLKYSVKPVMMVRWAVLVSLGLLPAYTGHCCVLGLALWGSIVAGKWYVLIYSSPAIPDNLELIPIWPAVKWLIKLNLASVSGFLHRDVGMSQLVRLYLPFFLLKFWSIWLLVLLWSLSGFPLRS